MRGLLVGLAVLPAVAVTVLAVILLRHTPTHGPAAGTSVSNLAVNAPQQPNVPPADWPYIQAAQRATVARDPACSTSARREPLISQGAPGRALLATLGVLRTPRTAADALPQPLSQGILAHGLLAPTRGVSVVRSPGALPAWRQLLHHPRRQHPRPQARSRALHG